MLGSLSLIQRKHRKLTLIYFHRDTLANSLIIWEFNVYNMTLYIIGAWRVLRKNGGVGEEYEAAEDCGLWPGHNLRKVHQVLRLKPTYTEYKGRLMCTVSF